MDIQLENTLFEEYFNHEFDFLNNYKATQVMYFTLGELYFFSPKKWFLSSKLLNLCV